jgi:hypothetical protein
VLSLRTEVNLNSSDMVVEVVIVWEFNDGWSFDAERKFSSSLAFFVVAVAVRRVAGGEGRHNKLSSCYAFLFEPLKLAPAQLSCGLHWNFCPCKRSYICMP